MWWLERKKAYIAHIDDASRDALLVSAADKLHNARSILMDLRTLGDGVWVRFNAERDDILWYYRELHEALRQRELVPTPLLEELRLVIDKIERLSWESVQREPPHQTSARSSCPRHTTGVSARAVARCLPGPERGPRSCS